MSPTGLRRLAVTSLLWLAVFALLFSIGHSLGLWPELPAAAARSDADLTVGIAAGVALLLALLLARGSGR